MVSSIITSSSNDPPILKPEKNQQAKAKRRKKKARHTLTNERSHHYNNGEALDAKSEMNYKGNEQEDDEDLDVEYVPEALAPELEEYFKSVADRFHKASVKDAVVEVDFELPVDEEMDSEIATRDKEDHEEKNEIKLESEDETEKVEDEEEEEEDEETAMKKKLRKERRLTVAELKQLVERPEVVEWVDVRSADPKLLVDIKSSRNVVPIPVHWSQKRKYLQNKRGIEKPPFELPEFIRATGIQTLREMSEKPDATLKQKTRERVQPKMGKLVIDYAKLHDAFFKWQTKPEMTSFGEMYYEGREYETKLRTVRPCAPLSEELKEALNMPPFAPPPWLINMQRFGPPPSYPGLKIPGLNAPIPNGAQWGFHPGGWGKPPVDEYGRPLYGDVFGTSHDPNYIHPYAVPVEKEQWGELPLEEKEEEELLEEEEMEEEDMDDDDDDEDMEGEEEEPHSAMLEIAELTVVNQGQAMVDKKHDEVEDAEEEDMEIEEFVAGLETPAIPTEIELRKTTTSSTFTNTVPKPLPTTPPPSLYTILPEKKISVSGMMGSERIYDLGSLGTEAAAAPSSKKEQPESQSEITMSSVTTQGGKEEKKRKVEEKKKKEFKF